MTYRTIPTAVIAVQWWKHGDSSQQPEQYNH